MLTPMTWEEICDDPLLRDLPYKIETNNLGQFIMSPARSRHGEYQAEILLLLRRLLPHGRGVIECPVQTTDGVRVPDVAWTSPERRQPVVYTLAPELCVEVLSPYNSEREMMQKRTLYFQAGALEYWQCAEDGTITFYGPEGVLTDGSKLCPGFPAQVVV